jgi:phosphoribosyl 1,2-cyclic phosphate phosphodiesterase
MRITLLGTGDAVGTPKIWCSCPACVAARTDKKSRRYRPCMMFSDGRVSVMIETGPDLRSQMLENDIKAVDAVLWTHAHRDHYGGFGDFYRSKENMPVYGEKRVLDAVLNEFHYLTFERHDQALHRPFMIGDMEFTLFEVTHPPIDIATGFRVRHNGKTVVVTGDTNIHIPAESFPLMENADLLIADAIVPPGINIPKHMNAADAMELSKKLGPKRTVFVHLSHLYKPHDEAVKEYPLGFDGMVIDV